MHPAVRLMIAESSEKCRDEESVIYELFRPGNEEERGVMEVFGESEGIRTGECSCSNLGDVTWRWHDYRRPRALKIKLPAFVRLARSGS